jgi:hypothetical protein
MHAQFLAPIPSRIVTFVVLLLSLAVLLSCGPSDKAGYDVLRTLIH